VLSYYLFYSEWNFSWFANTMQTPLITAGEIWFQRRSSVKHMHTALS